MSYSELRKNELVVSQLIFFCSSLALCSCIRSHRTPSSFTKTLAELSNILPSPRGTGSARLLKLPTCDGAIEQVEVVREVSPITSHKAATFEDSSSRAFLTPSTLSPFRLASLVSRVKLSGTPNSRRSKRRRQGGRYPVLRRRGEGAGEANRGG